LAIQAVYYLNGIIWGQPHPFHADEASKFNPMQQIAYVGVVYALCPLLIITGLFAHNPDWLGSFNFLVHWVFSAHLVLAIASLVFLVGHLYLCTTGRTPVETFRAMIDGYHR
jgi:thiosulfate reductase cytochrome b subunit